MNFIVKAVKAKEACGICGIVCGVECTSEIVCDLWLLACGKL